MTSIYRAELFAIIQALIYIEDKEPGTYIICSDSLSVLQSIAVTTTLDSMIQELLNRYQSLASENKLVTFVWSPGHIGIPGNERADELARQATSGPPDGNALVHPDDLKAYLKSRILSVWQHRWNQCSTMLKRYKPDVRKSLLPPLSRREQITGAKLISLDLQKAFDQIGLEHKINNLAVVKSLETSDIKDLIPAVGDRKKFISHVNNPKDTQND
ncbi:unnamed protein product, partial [Callosobruchus maculatus]